MKIWSNAMSNELRHNTQSVFLRMLIDASTNSIEWDTRTTHANRFIQTFFGDINQVPSFIINIANQKSSRTVAMKSFVENLQYKLTFN